MNCNTDYPTCIIILITFFFCTHVLYIYSNTLVKDTQYLNVVNFSIIIFNLFRLNSSQIPLDFTPIWAK